MRDAPFLEKLSIYILYNIIIYWIRCNTAHYTGFAVKFRLFLVDLGEIFTWNPTTVKIHRDTIGNRVGIREKASIPLIGEHGRISLTWWRECGGPLSRLACVMPSLGVLPVFYRQGSARILLEFCSNLARILLEFRSSQTQKMLRLNEELCAKFRRRKKKKHWRAKTGQSATNFSHCRKGILSVTLPRSFVTTAFFLLEFCSNFARIFPKVARFLTSCSIFNVMLDF